MAEGDRTDPSAAAPVELRDAAMLRAFAHPIRQRIVRELSMRTHARAADLAGWLGEPANSLSFHLRTLAKAGLIREVPEKARDKRDRVWEISSQGGFSIEDPASEAGVSSFVAERFAWLRQLIEGGFDDEESVSTVQFCGALLTDDEAQELIEELRDVVSKWRTHGAERAEATPDDPQRRVYDVTFALGRASQH